MREQRDSMTVAEIGIPDTLPVLSKGNHPAGSNTPCVMEAASWLAGEPWSDRPRSVHPVIARIARQVNDYVEDEERQRLWPLVLASLDTARRFRPILRLRLARFASQLSTCARPDHTLWETVLDRYGQLSGADPRRVSPGRGAQLKARLDEPFRPTRAERRRPRAWSNDTMS